MSITKMFEDMTQYLTEAFGRIFGPQEEELPHIGVQPFECSPFHENSEIKG